MFDASSETTIHSANVFDTSPPPPPLPPPLRSKLKLKSMYFCLFRYQITTSPESLAILRSYLCNSILFHRDVFSPAHFTCFFPSSHVIEVTPTTNFETLRDPDELITMRSKTQRLVKTKSISTQSLHPYYIVKNHPPTGISLDNLAVTSSRAITTRISFPAALQNTGWDYFVVPQTRKHVAWHVLFFWSLKDPWTHSLCIYALRLVGPVLNSTVCRSTIYPLL